MFFDPSGLASAQPTDPRPNFKVPMEPMARDLFLRELVQPKRGRSIFDGWSPSPVTIMVTQAMRRANGQYLARKAEIALSNYLAAKYAATHTSVMGEYGGAGFELGGVGNNHELLAETQAANALLMDKAGNSDATTTSMQTSTDVNEAAPWLVYMNTPTVYVVSAEVAGFSKSKQAKIERQIRETFGDAGINVWVKFVSEVPDEEALGDNDRYVEFTGDDDAQTQLAIKKLGSGVLGTTSGNRRRTKRFKKKRIAVRQSQVGGRDGLDLTGVAMVISHELIHSWGVGSRHARTNRRNDGTSGSYYLDIMLNNASIDQMNGGNARISWEKDSIRRFLGQQGK